MRVPSEPLLLGSLPKVGDEALNLGMEVRVLPPQPRRLGDRGRHVPLKTGRARFNSEGLHLTWSRAREGAVDDARKGVIDCAAALVGT